MAQRKESATFAILLPRRAVSSEDVTPLFVIFFVYSTRFACVLRNLLATNFQEIIAAVDFRVASCDESDGYPEPSWIRVQVGRKR